MPETEVENPEESQDQSGAPRLVPVGESIKYRRRAQQAETRIQEVEQKLGELQTQLHAQSDELAAAEAQRDETNHQLTVTRNRLSAERILSCAGVVDLDAASLLLSKRVDLGEELDPDTLAQSVERLLVDKPFLAKEEDASLPPRTASIRNVTMAANLAKAAEKASQTGNRRHVAEYLRLRREIALSNNC